MNNSPYLDRPLLPLTIALPRMLEKIGVELPMAGPAEAQRLRQRAQLILDRRSRSDLIAACRLGSLRPKWGGLAAGRSC